MLKDISRARLVGGWFVAVVVMIACAVVGGVAITTSNIELSLVAGLVPPAVMLLVWPGAPVATVTELLYAVNKPEHERRP